MSRSAADRLLRATTQLDPDDRLRHVLRVARELPAPDRSALLADLGGRGPSARRLALHAAVATRDVAHLARVLDDSSPTLRAGALAAPGLPDDLLRRVLERGAAADRVRAGARLARGGREALADAVVAAVRERWGDREAARILPGCSADVVAAQLPALAHAVGGWGGLVHRHGDAALALAAAQLAALPAEARAGWWSGRVVAALLEHRPADVLDLAERWLRGPLPPAVAAGVHRLLAVDVGRTVALLRADPERLARFGSTPLRRAACGRLVMVSDGELGALVRDAGPSLLPDVLRALPPSRRAAVFDAAHAGRDLATVVLPEPVLARLPHARRAVEARRMLALPAVADDPVARLRVTAHLPVDAARERLLEVTRSADADERALGHELLVTSAAATGAPAEVTAVLGLLERVRNERDPVRCRVLGAVAGVRPALVEEAALPRLDRLVADALDARDASAATVSAVQRLALGLLAHPWPDGAGQARWALGTVDRLGAWSVAGMLGARLAGLPHRLQDAVLDRLERPLRDAVARGYSGGVLGIARALGRRARSQLVVQDLLSRVIEDGPEPRVREAVALWLAARATRLDRAAALVARDASMLMLPAVLDPLVRHRAAPVERHVLAGRPLRGRFGVRDAWWLPTVPVAVLRRWTDDQVTRYADLLDVARADARLDRSSRARLTAQVVALRGEDRDGTADGPDVLLAEAALTGLGRGEAPEAALPVLLRHVDGDRARVALYAAARCARAVPPDRLPTLTGAKVTTRKEAVRWLAGLRPPGALDALVGDTDPHRDVRIARLGALRAFLPDERAWAAHETAVVGERFGALAAVGVVPGLLPDGLRGRYATLVARATTHPDDAVARYAHQVLPRWLPWAPEVADALAAGCTDLAGTAVWPAALDAALQPHVWTARPDLLPMITTALLATGEALVDGSPRRDRPAGQRLDTLLDGLAHQGAVARRHPEPVRAVADLVAADPARLTAAARLRAVVLQPGDRLVDDLLYLARSVAGRPLAAAAAAAALPFARVDPADLVTAADALVDAAPDGGAAGLLAVAVVGGAGAGAGWPESWRGRLDRLRAHPDPDVRAAARAVVTAAE